MKPNGTAEMIHFWLIPYVAFQSLGLASDEHYQFLDEVYHHPHLSHWKCQQSSRVSCNHLQEPELFPWKYKISKVIQQPGFIEVANCILHRNVISDGLKWLVNRILSLQTSPLFSISLSFQRVWILFTTVLFQKVVQLVPNSLSATP